MAQIILKQSPNQTFSSVGSHSRSLSLSQPTFIANNCLPPLSPPPPGEPSLASSISNLKNMPMEEIDVTSQGSATTLPCQMENPFRGNGGLPPRRGHRRSSSDVPLGFSTILQSSPQLVPISSQGILNQAGDVKKIETEMVCYVNCGERTGARKSEGEVVDNFFDSLMDLDNVGNLNTCSANGVGKDAVVSASSKKNDATAPQVRHYRSLSMDSGIGDFEFGDLSPNLPTSLCYRADQFFPSNSLSENLANVTLDFGHGEFNEVELKKIKADERLAEIAISDPKRAKRILANRQSAARSKERKLRYISELGHKVQTLQTEATTLSAQITTLQKDHSELTNENNELKFRIHAVEQQAQLREALHETLTAEVQRLKVANMEFREQGRTNGFAQQVSVKHNMFSMQHQQRNQGQRLSVTSSLSSST